MLTTLLAFLLVIGVLVLVHELGHLIAAKAVDIECPRFSIGFGPRLFGFQWGETEYVVSALPLGGYVRMAGMEDTAALEGGEEEPEREPSDRDFDAKPLWARIIVVTAGVLMNFLFAIVVIAALGIVYGQPVNPDTRVAIPHGPDAPTMPAPIAGIPLGARITAVGNEPVKSWYDVAEALSDAPAGPLTLHFADSPPAQLSLPAGDSARSAYLEGLQPYLAPVIGQVSPSSAASRAGLQPGDSVLSAAGRPLRTWVDFVDVVRAHPEQALPLTVQREGHPVSVTVTPDRQSDTVDGKQVEIGRLGVASDIPTAHRPMGLGESLRSGWDFTWGTSSEIVTFLGGMFTGAASPRMLGGPLTIGEVSGQAVRMGLEVLLRWMALLSVNLAVLNLLPVPVLDGGQLLFLVIEGVRGRPLSLEQRLRMSHVGLIIVVGIMVWAITNDVLRLFGI